MLERLENEPVEMKVTLAYFIESNPGLPANVDPQRYPSFGLRLDLQRRNESASRFKQRVNPSDREDPQRRTPGPRVPRAVQPKIVWSSLRRSTSIWTSPRPSPQP
jgi:hypothetical protein